MSRITMYMTIQDAIIVLAEGNPGALRVCMDIFYNGPKIDPDRFSEGAGYLIDLDEYEIYGPRIWMLYKDACKENLCYMFAVLRACQLGQLAIEKVNHAIDNYGEGLDLPEIMKAVQSRILRFNTLPIL